MTERMLYAFERLRRLSQYKKRVLPTYMD